LVFVYELLRNACRRGDVAQVEIASRGILGTMSEPRPDLACFNGVITSAIESGQIGVVQHFLNSELFNRDKLPVHAAVQAKSTVVLELFLDHGWNINQPCDRDKPPLLA
jgi:hypothetical protein